jgi:hypothetical protein
MLKSKPFWMRVHLFERPATDYAAPVMRLLVSHCTCASGFKKREGRNDQMMAVYLPYCDRFVTRDKKQLERLRDVSAEAKLNCEVSSYDAFCADFEVVV